MNVGILVGITQALALTMSISFLVYVALIVVPFLRLKKGPVGNPLDFEWHLLIPCRDEEAVIGQTISYLRQNFPEAHVWVIDDASEDDTANVVRGHQIDAGRHAISAERVHLIQRRQPYARTGKGDALNAAYRVLKQWIGKHNDAGRTIVVVVDADGRPAPNCLEVMAAKTMFGNPQIGATQVDVHMMNVNVPEPGKRGLRKWFGNELVRMQDMEFRTAISAVQLSRDYTGSIALGGNGQFTRMSALDSIAGDTGEPWRGSLLEDFELGVHLLTAGWKTAHSRDTHVAQEGLYDFRRYLTQRTRWGQGTMQCIRYVKHIWDSPHLPTVGAAEMMYYLSQPWMQLVGTLIYPVPMIVLTSNVIADPTTMLAWFHSGAWALFLMYLVFGFLPFMVWGPIYAKRSGTAGFLKGLWWGVEYAFYTYTFYITSWRGFFRIVRGRNGWAKTRRNAEHTSSRVVALDQ
jgi:cellulose synthase/poly-beta-1,6-N-acetylglucosamine synthase-like glycosyltransferase